jgi:hypothetical protein
VTKESIITEFPLFDKLIRIDIDVWLKDLFRPFFQNLIPKLLKAISGYNQVRGLRGGTRPPMDIAIVLLFEPFKLLNDKLTELGIPNWAVDNKKYYE